MSRFCLSFAIAALALASAASTACTHHTTVIVHTPEHVGFEAKCVETECDAQRDAASLSKACHDCIGVSADACDYDPLCPDTEETCRLECATDKCYGESPCLKYSWVATPDHLVVTPGVEDACQAAYADESTRCGVHLTDDDTTRIDAECANAALFDTDAGVAYYACFTMSACGKPASCTKPSSFGAELCSMPAGSCLSSCADPNHGGLDESGSLLKPAFLDAARTCMNETSCDQVNGCMSALWKLVDGT